ncbi:hypothetical protein EDD15DRAFT_2201375 [Pisolithus albus]|nr:hypothetical protein EDD15DRAFT_2201375 [Pisolithus albus]
MPDSVGGCSISRPEIIAAHKIYYVTSNFRLILAKVAIKLSDRRHIRYQEASAVRALAQGSRRTFKVVRMLWKHYIIITTACSGIEVLRRQVEPNEHKPISVKGDMAERFAHGECPGRAVNVSPLGKCRYGRPLTFFATYGSAIVVNRLCPKVIFQLERDYAIVRKCGVDSRMMDRQRQRVLTSDTLVRRVLRSDLSNHMLNNSEVQVDNQGTLQKKRLQGTQKKTSPQETPPLSMLQYGDHICNREILFHGRFVPSDEWNNVHGRWRKVQKCGRDLHTRIGQTQLGVESGRKLSPVIVLALSRMWEYHLKHGVQCVCPLEDTSINRLVHDTRISKRMLEPLSACYLWKTQSQHGCDVSESNVQVPFASKLDGCQSGRVHRSTDYEVFTFGIVDPVIYVGGSLRAVSKGGLGSQLIDCHDRYAPSL